MRRAREEMASQKRETFAQHRGMDPNASEECLVLLPARLNGRDYTGTGSSAAKREWSNRAKADCTNLGNLGTSSSVDSKRCKIPGIMSIIN